MSDRKREAERLLEELGDRRAVAQRMGITTTRVGQLLRRDPPRYVAGHKAKAPSIERRCKSCSKVFTAWLRQFYCNAPACRAKVEEARQRWYQGAGSHSLNTEDWRDNPPPRLVGPSITEELERAEVDHVLGDLALEDIPRLREDELERLRRDLLAVGVIPRSVQREERERLDEPEHHRGYGPSPERTRMSTRHKHRKPGHVKSAGSKRGSRKPKKRWDRERLAA